MKGFAVVFGMTIAYAVSFFGLLLAYIVYQRNHHPDDLWRARSVGVSFFSLLYGRILPLLALVNGLITLLVKVVNGWSYNHLIWTDQALTWPVAGALICFWLLGRQMWLMRKTGFAAAMTISAGAALLSVYYLGAGVSGGDNLQLLGVYATSLIWHLIWLVYFIRGTAQKSFIK